MLGDKPKHILWGDFDDPKPMNNLSAAWGSTVVGSSDGDGWLRTSGGIFLPMEIDGIPTMRPPGVQSFRDIEKKGGPGSVLKWQTHMTKKVHGT